MKIKEKSTLLLNGLTKLFAKAIEEKVFPGAAVSVTEGSGTLQQTFYLTFGGGDYKTGSINRKTFYDLASLTKPLATALAVMVLIKEKKISLQTSLGAVYQDITPEKKEIKIWHLLNHSSGMKDHQPYFLKLAEESIGAARPKIVQLALAEPLQAKPGSKQLYSDLGFIILGDLVEKLSGQALDHFIEEKVYRPLALSRNLLFKPTAPETCCAPTEVCGRRQKLLCGQVHDDNAAAVGGVSGQAGLFGNITGVTDLVNNLKEMVLANREHPNIDAKTLRKAVCRKNNKGSWGLGFDTPSTQGSSAGQYFSAKSFGHLGFTGTSFWVDLDREISIVLLSNRVHPDRQNNKIRKFRPLFHDTVMKILLEKE